MDAKAVQALIALWHELQDEEGSLESRLSEVRMERQVVERALQRRGALPEAGEPPLAEQRVAQDLVAEVPPSPVVPAPPPFSQPVADGWELLNFTQAVQKVLGEARDLIGPQDVLERLAEVGKLGDRDASHVRGALAHLKRTGKAASGNRGEWMLAEGPVFEAWKARQEQAEEDDVFHAFGVDGDESATGPTDDKASAVGAEASSVVREEREAAAVN